MDNSSLYNLTSKNTTLTGVALWSSYQTSFTAWFTIGLLSSFSFGSFNLLCLLMICRTPTLRTGAGILIGHMLLIETLMSLILLPVLMTFVFIHLSSILTCRIVQFIFAMVNIAVYYNILILAINRFVAIIFPYHYRQLTQSRWIMFFISFIWLASFSINIPMELNGGVGHYGVERVWGGCTPTLIKPGQFDYRIVHAWLGSYVPLVLSGILYILIQVKAWLKSFRRHVTPAETAASAARKTRRFRQKMNMSYLLLFSFLAYCVCFLCHPLIARSFPKLLSLYPMILQWMTILFTWGYAVHSVSEYSTINKRPSVRSEAQ